jgi:hypothetical protein
VGLHDIGRNGDRPVVYAQPAPRPNHSVAVCRASHPSGRSNMSWTKSYEHAKWWWRDEEGCEADGRHNRVIYRAQVPPQAILAYMVYPEVEYSDGYGDQFVVDPEFLSDFFRGFSHKGPDLNGDGRKSAPGW